MDRRSVLAGVASLGVAAALAPAASAEIKPYAPDALAKAVAAGIVVVHVHADWCPVCKVQVPTLTAMSNDPKLAKVAFIKVDFDKDKDFLRANKVANQSVIVVFKGGKEVTRLNGITDPAGIRDAISRVL